MTGKSENVVYLDKLRDLEASLAEIDDNICTMQAADDLPPDERADALGALYKDRASIEAAIAKSRGRANSAEAKRTAEAEQERRAREWALDFLKANDLYYILGQGAYLWRVGGRHEFVKPSALRETFAELRSFDSKLVFDELIESQKRRYFDVTYSFRPVPPTTLNLMSRKHWCQPVAGECHPIFGHLLHALGGGKQENIDHIEQVIRWKWRHPEDEQIPCLVIFGEGRVGKNLLVSRVGKTLFGADQVRALVGRMVMGQFNGALRGLTLCYVDEGVADKSDMERLKSICSNSRIAVEQKFFDPVEIDNTALYIIGGNGIRSPIRLGFDQSDERWSIIYAAKTLRAVVAEREGISEAEARDYLAEHVPTLSDPAEVGKWLYTIGERWKHLNQCPAALHGEDYSALRTTQKPSWMEMCEAVFGQVDFTHIKIGTFREMYHAWHRENYPGFAPLARNTLYAQVREWLAKDGHRIVQRNLHLGGTTADCWIDPGAITGSSAMDNDRLYYALGDHGEKEWTFPLV